MNMKSILLAGAVAMAPFAASAATIAPGASVDVLADQYDYNEEFMDGAAGATISFTFNNYELYDVAVTIASITAGQLGTLAYFTDGVTATFTGGVGGVTAGSIAMGAIGAGSGIGLSTTILAGSSAVLSITYGDVSTKGGKTTLDMIVDAEAVAVPLPAGALLLGTALGGLGLARRRKS